MWHAALAAEDDATTADYIRLDDLFGAYTETLGEQEQRLTVAAHVYLSNLLNDEWDNWPRCKNCGARLCPHRGERYREQSH
jgi:hypothetical protein